MGKYELQFVHSSKMQRSPLKVVICGRWKHCSKVIHRPGFCSCTVVSCEEDEQSEGTR